MNELKIGQKPTSLEQIKIGMEFDEGVVLGVFPKEKGCDHRIICIRKDGTWMPYDIEDLSPLRGGVWAGQEYRDSSGRIKITLVSPAEGKVVYEDEGGWAVLDMDDLIHSELTLITPEPEVEVPQDILDTKCESAIKAYIKGYLHGQKMREDAGI